MNSTLVEIETQWTLGEILTANLVLNSLEDAERRAYKKAKRESK